MEIAVLIPCYNESTTIAKVISDFRKELPEATIYVYDNNSTDGTDNIARKAGAIVRYECRQGKGNVIRKMFSEINADIYIIVDGDDTYPAESIHKMLQSVMDGKADIANGDRLSNLTYAKQNKRAFHNFGNQFVLKSINILFKADLKDIMTGYRVFNKKFVKNFAIMSKGFEIETEMTLHALDKNYNIKEIMIEYRDRPKGSYSKLNTFSDGIKVIKTIILIFKDYKPLAFFGNFSLFLFLLGLVCGTPVLYEYYTTRFITRIPLTILAASLVVLALLSLVCALILDTIMKADRRNYELRLIQFTSENCSQSKEGKRN